LVEQLTGIGKPWAWARFDAREMVRQIEAIYVEELQRRGLPLPPADALTTSGSPSVLAAPTHE
jgi:hypothetical protein